MNSQSSVEQGCHLPEELRQYYLDTIGITNWQLQQAVVPVEAASHSADVITEPEQPGTLSEHAPESAIESEIWQSLEQAVAGCQRCNDLAASRTQTVFGVGDRQAKLLVIGEAPGRDEDAQGEPFVGRAGQLLNAMLQAIGLQREQVFIANVLKCRPPNNRDPSAEEIQSCKVYLQQQIRLLQPKAIFIVGRIAAQNLLSTEMPIGKMRGRDYHYDSGDNATIPVIVTYHPAYLLRKPTEKRKSWQDLLRLKRLMSTWQ